MTFVAEIDCACVGVVAVEIVPTVLRNASRQLEILFWPTASTETLSFGARIVVLVEARRVDGGGQLSASHVDTLYNLAVVFLVTAAAAALSVRPNRWKAVLVFETLCSRCRRWRERWRLSWRVCGTETESFQAHSLQANSVARSTIVKINKTASSVEALIQSAVVVVVTQTVVVNKRTLSCNARETTDSIFCRRRRRR